MNNCARLFLCCALCLLLASTALAQKRRRTPPVWGAPEVFSDLSLELETGDVGGMEVILIPVYGGMWATVVVASGIAYEPILVNVTENGTSIEFTLPETEHYAGYGKFKGKITRSGLTLWNRTDKYFLRRVCR